MTIRRMCIACWIPKATNTNSEYVIFIAFPLQQCLHERASILLYVSTFPILVCCVLCRKRPLRKVAHSFRGFLQAVCLTVCNLTDSKIRRPKLELGCCSEE
jgi:hypothetical protein